MNALDMPRKNAGYRLDERCIEALKVLAGRTGKSINEYLETLVFTHAQIQGVIAPTEKPLGETRGNRKSQAGRGKKAGELIQTESNASAANDPDEFSEN